MTPANRLSPTALEIASGVVTGRSPTAPLPAPAHDPLEALELAMLPGLLRPPCLVSFSGGMDSSFVLSVAARVARREGIAPPVPVTWRFTDAPRANESPWQDRVINALGLDDWQILHAVDDLDLIGPVAQRLLHRYGVQYPANLHLHLPIFEMARGGSLLTGWGGDQILDGGCRPAPASRLRSLRRRAPDRVVARLQHRRRDPFPWLSANASRQVIRDLRQDIRTKPSGIDHRIAWHAERRALLLANSGLNVISADNDVRLVHPLLDRGFLAAVARDAGGSTSLTRSELLGGIARGTLPETATMARPKAHFLQVFLRGQTREFTRSWDGLGADEAVVNAAALRRIWSRCPIPGGTAGLVQQLWLAHQGSQVTEIDR